jgi:hypothetical protein
MECMCEMRHRQKSLFLSLSSHPHTFSSLSFIFIQLGGTVHGEAEDDGTDAADPAMLLEVMEAREAVDDAAPGSPELAALAAEYKARAAALVGDLSAAFAAGDTEAAHAAAVRLRYATRIQQAVADKE